jgi:hypothetical protein
VLVTGSSLFQHAGDLAPVVGALRQAAMAATVDPARPETAPAP